MKTQTTPLDTSSTGSRNAHRILDTFLAAWWYGNVVQAANQFSDQFTFTDHALNLEFKDKKHLTEFLAMTREYFPDAKRTDNAICRSEDLVVSEWTLTATRSEPFPGGLTRKVPIRVRGISVVRTRSGKIVEWSDYYDQMTAQRSGLASRFTERTEL